MENKETIKFEGYEASAVVHEILHVAQVNSHCGFVGCTSADLKITPEHVRDAANLVFLALDLFEEWKTR